MQNQLMVVAEVKNTNLDKVSSSVFSEFYVRSGFGKEDDYQTESGSDSYLSVSE